MPEDRMRWTPVGPAGQHQTPGKWLMRCSCGTERYVFKDPVTDDGTKRSARGRLAVARYVDSGQLHLIDGRTMADELANPVGDEMRTVWQNGRFINPTNLADIRKRLRQ